ncbi:hypothetical protein KY285_000954 [Solanum tuberosum]|nr:hypothetical protein KY285_000954 [Solanum tuberosum]
MRQLNDQKRNSNREQIEEAQSSSNFSFRAAKRDLADEEVPRGSQHGKNTEGNNEEQGWNQRKEKKLPSTPVQQMPSNEGIKE